MRRLIIVTFLFTVGINSVFAQQNKITREIYINTFSELAVQEMIRTNIPASITLAQGILESGNGNSTLAVKANNHFGIKCHNTWKGKTIRHDDDARRECFRKYNSVIDSYKDHSDFLMNTPRYRFLFEYKLTDYKSWAKGLKKAGYATANHYDKMLIRIIEDNKLYVYDNISERESNKIEDELRSDIDDKYLKNASNTYNNIDYVVFNEGDNLEQLARANEKFLWELNKFNEIDEENNQVLKPGMKVFLQPKRNKAIRGLNSHKVVNKNQSLWEVSQYYGVKLKKLIKFNDHINPESISIGDIIYLNRKNDKKNEIKQNNILPANDNLITKGNNAMPVETREESEPTINKQPEKKTESEFEFQID